MYITFPDLLLMKLKKKLQDFFLHAKVISLRLLISVQKKVKCLGKRYDSHTILRYYDGILYKSMLLH